MEAALRPRGGIAAAPSRGAWLGALFLLAAAFAIRGIWFGDPVAHVDEEFYLLVGDRMLHAGALPFVDIWDRKPVGLFLFYAGVRLLGGGGIVQYQVVATLLAWGTALVVMRLARFAASWPAATLAGAAYLLWLGLLGGHGGQTPVFYNLPMALAGWLTLRAVVEEAEPRRILRLGAGAMSLTGLALQIKYTAVFEGIFFGCALVWAYWRGVGAEGWRATAGAALLWVALALAPTAAALGWYVAVGQGRAFVFANFLSIGGRGGAPMSAILARLRNILLILSPLLLTLAFAWRRGRGAHHDFLLFWLGAAIVGFLLFGTYYDHYALPLLPPLCVALAPTFDRERGWVPVACLLLFGAVGNGLVRTRQTAKLGDEAYVERLVAMIRPNLRGRCLFVYEGEPILYYRTGACIPTRYAFPSHLDEQLEAHAIGADPVAEVRAALARRPGVIVDTVDRPSYHRRHGGPHPGDNAATAALVAAEFARDYRLVGQIGLRRDIRRVWARLPGR